MRRHSIIFAACICMVFFLLTGNVLAKNTGLEIDLSRSFQQIRPLLTQIEQKLDAKQPVEDDIARLVVLAQEVKAIDLIFEQRFVKQSEQLSIFGSAINDRQHHMQQVYREKVTQFLDLIELLQQKSSNIPKIITELIALLTDDKPAPMVPIYGSVPYAHTDFANTVPDTSQNITPAYLGGDPETTDDDLASTDLAPNTTEIAQLAQSLEWNPSHIYEWVKNNIQTEWYYGSMKGAVETLRQKSGNDCDQAALLIAMLRASGFPARYVRGVVSFFPGLEAGKKLIGVSENWQVPVFLQKAGIPFEPVLKNGQLQNIRFEHVWVESLIPYSNYRGAVIDEHGKTWLGLDTAIKNAGYNQSQPQNILAQMDLTLLKDAYLESVRSQTVFEFLTDEIKTYLDQNYSGVTFEDLLAKQTLIPEKLGILPANLQFVQDVIVSESTQLPQDLILNMDFKAKDQAGQVIIDGSLPLYKLSNHKIDLTYEPETIEDQEVINFYHGLSNTPSYLVHLRPVIKIDDQRTIIGQKGFAIGTEYKLTTEISSPAGARAFENIHYIGNPAVIGVVCQNTVTPSTIPDDEKTAGQFLFEFVTQYIDTWNQAESQFASLLQLSLIRPLPTIVTTGGTVSVTDLLGVPYSMDFEGLYIDVDSKTAETVGGLTFNNDTVTDRLFMQLVSMQGSVLEDRILAQNFNVDCISTAKVFGMAHTNGAGILHIDSSNIDTQIASLPVSSGIKQDIQNAVHQGLTVDIPALQTSYEDWTGTGYITQNPETGESGWMLSGGIGGGMTAWSVSRWNQYFNEIMSNPYNEQPNYDSTAGMYIQKITSTDMQKGIVGKILDRKLQVLVTDRNHKPVKGAEVIFSVSAGGGNFDNGEVTKIASTGFDGIAEVDFYLGKHTENNPIWWMEDKFTYVEKAGANIVNASLPNISVKSPFTAIGRPDTPYMIKKTFSDHSGDYTPDNMEGGMADLLSYVGWINVLVVDKYDNPLSNKEVTFKVGPTTTEGFCGYENSTDTKPAVFIDSDDTCLNSYPHYGECSSQTGEIKVISSHLGANAHIILGGMPRTTYTFEVTCGTLSPVIYSWEAGYFGDCAAKDEPARILRFRFDGDNLYTDANNIAGGAIGEKIKISGRAYIVEEASKNVRDFYKCDEGSGQGSEPVLCSLIYGLNYHEVATDFSSASYMINDAAAKDLGNGRFETEYVLKPGRNEIPYDIRVSIIRDTVKHCCDSYCEGNTCEIITKEMDFYGEDSGYTPEKGNLVIYGIIINNITPKAVPLTTDGYFSQDYKLSFQLDPPNYKPNLAYIEIFKNEKESITYIPVGPDENGIFTGTISRGFKVDLNNLSSLNARLVLNPGNKAEIKGPKETLSIRRIKDLSVKNPKLIPISSGQYNTLLAERIPVDMKVIWSIKARYPQTIGQKIIAEIDSVSGVISISKDSAFGEIVVRAEDSENPSVFKEAVVEVGCPRCYENGQCEESSGNGFVRLDSVNIRLSLGKGENGQPAGQLFLRSDVLSRELATPKLLEFSTLLKGIDVVYDEEGIIKQILAPQTFVNIETLTPYSYEIRFYDPSAHGPKTGNLYELDTAAQPTTIWKIENPDASDSTYNQLYVTKTKNGKVNEYKYKYDQALDEWSLDKGKQIKYTLKSIDSSTGDQIIKTRTQDDLGQQAANDENYIHEFDFGKTTIKRIIDPTGEALVTTMSYYEDASQTGSYGKLYTQINPDGSWIKYVYDDQGRTIKEIRSWLDAPVSSSESDAYVTEYDYTPVDVDDTDDPEFKHQARTTVEKIQGIVVSKTYYAYMKNSDDGHIEIVERCIDPGATYADTTNLRTQTTYYPYQSGAANSDDVKEIRYADGRLDTYTYEYGSFTEDANPENCEFLRGYGQDIRQTVVHGTVSHPQGMADKTTKETSITDYFGNLRLQGTYVYNGSDYDRIQWTVQYYDESGHVVQTNRSDGTKTESQWDCCGKVLDIDATGIVQNYTYDQLNRVEEVIKQGTADQKDIKTNYSYDAVGRTIGQTISAGGLSLSSSTQYDLAGRIRTSTDTADLITSYTYALGGLLTTVTRPGGATEITERYPDGKTKSITGTGVIARYYEYGVNPDGTQWTKVYTGSMGSPNWEKTTTDLLGRTTMVERPGYTGTQISQNYYNRIGQLIKTSSTGQADALYEYDELGNQERSGQDINGNGVLDLASNDRINETETLYHWDNQDWWQVTQQTIYAIENNATPVQVGTQRDRLTHLGLNGLTHYSESTDIYDNMTTSKVVIDRENKLTKQIVDYPDSDTDALTVSQNGRMISSRDKSGIEISFAYDDLGRRTSVTDPRTGTSTTHFNPKGQVDYVSDPAGNATHFIYDPNTGLKIADENALNQFTRYKYNDQGQITQTWGDTAYPTEYRYDPYGRLAELHTFRSELGWSGDTWPTGTEAAADVTKWHYQDETGLLVGKEDAQGKQVTYTYQTDGKLKTRTWARLNNNNPLTTTYSYDPNTGELLNIDYSDTTPDITFTYDRLGRQKNVADALGSRTFGYNADLQLETETITGLYNRTITRTYETSGVIGRTTGFTLDSNYTVSYGFDGMGRFNSIGWNVAGQTGMATYGYLPNSNLLESVTTLAAKNTTYAYEPHRNLKTQVQNSSSGQVVSQYDYQYDELGRRSSVQNSGLAFGTPAFNKWGYDARSQLTESRRYNGTDINDLSMPVDPETRLFGYDPIGNRTTATEGTENSTYAANNLNQYDSITTGANTKPFAYDDDGNLTAYDGKVLRFNGENRLISVEPATPGSGDKKVEFVYDFQGRRVKKSVFAFTGTWQLEKEILFVWDGWNLAEEITKIGANETSKFYACGLDLSQSLQGAGGIGGLLATIDNGTTYYHFYDGNGNTSQLVNGSDGSIAASYEYDPYGNSIKADGAYAQENRYQFSTKYTDIETELVYYGYRYYAAELGRWLNRDPIEELGFEIAHYNMDILNLNGELNLYSYLGENPLDLYDVYGLGKPPGNGKPPGYGKKGKWKDNKDGTYEDPKGHKWRWHDSDKDPKGKRHKDHWDVTDKKKNKTRRDPVTGEDMEDAIDEERNEVENKCDMRIKSAAKAGGALAAGYITYRVIKFVGGTILILTPEPSTTALGCCIVLSP